MNDVERTPESNSIEEIAVQLVETNPAPPTVQLGTNPNRLYTLRPTDTVVDFNIKTTPWDLKVDETLLDGEGITPGIRFIPSVSEYEVILVSRTTRLTLRIMPWLVRFRPKMRRITLKPRLINITKKQYDQLVGNRLDDDVENEDN